MRKVEIYVRKLEKLCRVINKTTPVCYNLKKRIKSKKSFLLETAAVESMYEDEICYSKIYKSCLPQHYAETTPVFNLVLALCTLLSSLLLFSKRICKFTIKDIIRIEF